MIQIPVDIHGIGIQATPVGISLARTIDASISGSTEITFNTSSTWIRVFAIAKDIYFRWGIEDVDLNYFDEMIIAGNYLDLQIPTQPDGTLYTACNVIEREAGATVVLIEK